MKHLLISLLTLAIPSVSVAHVASDFTAHWHVSDGFIGLLAFAVGCGLLAYKKRGD